MRLFLTAQLKRLRRHPVPDDVVARGRAALQAHLEAYPVAPRVAAGFSWRPVAVMMILVIVLMPGGLALAAHDALPGDALYQIKIAVEGARTAMTRGEEARFRLLSDQAERRLHEAEALMAAERVDAKEKDERVGWAMAAYEDRVFDLSIMAAKAGVESENPKTEKAAERLERLLERHERLFEKAGDAGVDEATVVLPVRTVLELESSVLDLAESRRRGREKSRFDDGMKKRVEARAEKLRVRLDRIERRDENDEVEDEESAGDERQRHEYLRPSPRLD